MSKKNNHWPDEWEQGLIKTTNAMGVMFKELSPAAEAFVHYARHADGPLLDIGCAYGVATIPALNNGGELIGCDLSDEHLSILRQSISSDLLQKKLTTTTSSFPYALSFQPKSLSGILISNVLHFMDGETIVDGLSKCWQWLKPDGKLFINVMTPHLSFYHQLIPEYQHRVDAGVTWPGIFNPKLVASDKWKDNLPDFVHLFEPDTLQKIVEQASFIVNNMTYFCYKNYPDEHRTNGKEFISLCATKRVEKHK